MLILTRRPIESVVIGSDPDINNNIVITVLGVRGNQVRIGVKAGRHIAVHRQEIFERIKLEQQQNGGAPAHERSAAVTA